MQKQSSAKKQVVPTPKEFGEIINAFNDYFAKTDYQKQSIEGKERFVYRLCLRLYLKFSVIAPAKKSVLLNIKFSDFDSDFNHVVVNELQMNIPANLRSEILAAAEFVEKETGVCWTNEDIFFDYIRSIIRAKRQKFDTALNGKFCLFLKEYNLLNIDQKAKSFPLEIISAAIVRELIIKGLNPIYISKISGISVTQLAKNYSDEIDTLTASAVFNEANPFSL